MAPGRWQGARYRLTGGHPADDVTDDVLADRIRSSIGPLEKRLDLPRIHVTTRDAVAVLHGDVATDAERVALEDGVLDVHGVRGVESHLHVGLAPGDTRPSEGRAHAPGSDAKRRLEDAARRAGLSADRDAGPLLHSVLGAFVDRIPTGERDHVLGHLPADARVLATPPRRFGETRDLRTVDDLIRVARDAEPSLTESTALGMVREVLGTLAALVPEEGPDVGATLPADLAAFWRDVAPVPASAT